MSAARLVDVEQVRAGVDRELSSIVADLAHEAAELGADPGLVGELAAMITGGKRMRAALCYWSWRAHGGTPTDDEATRTVHRIGAALELFQAAALIHDDVMDASATRRGRPSAHEGFATVHRDQGWSGPAAAFGTAAAIVLGDLTLIASDRAFTAAVGDAAEDHLRARAIYDRMRTEVTVGQYLDVRAQTQPWGSPDLEEERARDIVRSKSARYSVEHPITLGAALAGAPDPDLARCGRIGLALGEAFQLRDDLLGVFGDPEVTGKPAGDDLREGKRTVLVARALRLGSPADRDLITDRLGRRDLSDEEVATLRDVLRRSGAAIAVERLISEIAVPALTELAAAPLESDGRTMLVRLGEALVDRTA